MACITTHSDHFTVATAVTCGSLEPVMIQPHVIGSIKIVSLAQVVYPRVEHCVVLSTFVTIVHVDPDTGVTGRGRLVHGPVYFHEFNGSVIAQNGERGLEECGTDRRARCCRAILSSNSIHDFEAEAAPGVRVSSTTRFPRVGASGCNHVC
jgi:hypothetical protein